MPSFTDINSVDEGFDALGYRYAGAENRSRDHAAYGERRLWCAVIAQAFVDIGVIAPAGKDMGPSRAKRQEFDAAARWLLRNNKSFPYICELAGVSPHIIRCAAQMFYGQSQLALGALCEPDEGPVTQS